MPKKSNLRRAIERERRYPETKGIAPQATPDWITPAGYSESRANKYTCERRGDFYHVSFKGRLIACVHVEEFYENAARAACRAMQNETPIKFTEGKRGDILFRKKGKVVDVITPEQLMLRQVTRLPNHFSIRDPQDYPHNRRDVSLALRRQCNYDLWLWDERRKFARRDALLQQHQHLTAFGVMARCLLTSGTVAA